MFLRYTTRKKNGKEHRYYSLVENRRVASGRVVQRHALYLGEINDSQEEAWRKTIEIFQEGQARPRTVALFPEERIGAVADADIVRIRLSQLSLHRPRQWGACWLAVQLWEQLGLDQFWAARLPPSRKGTRWDWVLQILVTYRLLDPGSEWRLYRHWFEHSAMGDLLGADVELAEIHKLYECHERLLEHKRDLFTHLTGRWKDLFNARFEVLLYDLTSTYFESDPPFPEGDKRRYGYSRDKRPDCVQVVIALIVTPEGFPLAYEVLAGNTSDKTTLADFLKKIEEQYGQAERIWVMDRGIPTEKVLEQMRAATPPVQYLVGTPRGRLSQYEQKLAGLPWQVAREGVSVKLLTEAQELYVLAESKDRVNKERAMRRRQLKGLWHRLKKLQGMKLKRDELLKKLGAALHEYPTAARLIDTTVAPQTAASDLHLAQRQTAPGAQARRPLPAAQQHHGRTNPRRTLAVLHPTDRSGSGLQKPQGRFEPAPHSPSIGTSDRSPHFHLVFGLLPARHAAPTPARLGSGPHLALGPGKICHHPNARCASAHDRRAHRDPEPLHPPGNRRSTIIAATQTGVTSPAAA